MRRIRQEIFFFAIFGVCSELFNLATNKEIIYLDKILITGYQ